MSWGDFFGKIAEQFQSRTERLKNELDKLEKEKSVLLNHPANLENAKRMDVIESRIDVIHGLLKNKAS